jgi:hypothetical protein
MNYSVPGKMRQTVQAVQVCCVQCVRHKQLFRRASKRDNERNNQKQRTTQEEYATRLIANGSRGDGRHAPSERHPHHRHAPVPGRPARTPVHLPWCSRLVSRRRTCSRLRDRLRSLRQIPSRDLPRGRRLFQAKSREPFSNSEGSEKRRKGGAILFCFCFRAVPSGGENS